jgi:hypothetical protein
MVESAEKRFWDVCHTSVPTSRTAQEHMTAAFLKFHCVTGIAVDVQLQESEGEPTREDRPIAATEAKATHLVQNQEGSFT